MVQRAAFAQRNAHKLLLGRFRCLADSLGHLACLAVAEAHATLLVANDDQGREAKALAALHHLRDAVDVDQLVDQFAALAAIVAAVASAAITAVAAGTLFSLFARH